MAKRLRRAGLPIAVSAVVAAMAVAGTIITNGTAGAQTAADPGALAIQQAAADAGKHAIAKPRRAVTRAATNERGFGDLTGDGKADLAAVDSTGVLWVYPGKQYRWDGTGTRSTSLFGARIRVGAGWGTFTSLVGPGDLTSDGHDDVLAVKSTGELVLYLGNGKTGFGSNRVIGSGWRGGPLIAVGDWTYDERTEIMFRSTSGPVRNYESRPGEFPIGKSEPVLDAQAGNALLNMVGMGDLTSDLEFEPIPDVVMQGKDGSLVLYTWDWTPVSPAATKIGSGWASYRIF